MYIPILFTPRTRQRAPKEQLLPIPGLRSAILLRQKPTNYVHLAPCSPYISIPEMSSRSNPLFTVLETH